MKLIRFLIAALLFFPSLSFGATLYLDGALVSNCTSGNYSIASRNCTGSDGNAYNNVQSAISSSANNDTINIRAGSYTSNASTTNGIVVKTGQTWQTYSGDLPSKATITAGATHDFVFQINGISNATVRNFIVENSQREAIRVWGSGNTTVTDNEVRDWNNINEEYWGGIGYRGAGATGLIARNYVHDPAFNTNGLTPGIVGGSSAHAVTVDSNRVENTSMGIWIDVDAGNPNIGLTPWVWTRNVVKNITRHCYHIEARSVAIMRYNIGIGCQETGVLIRPGASSTTNGLKIQHNSFYNLGLTGIWVQRDSATSQVINSNFDNNILHGNSSSAAAGTLLTVGTGITSEASNTFRNNLFFHSGTNTKAVCWNDAQGTSHSCDGSPTQYSTSQLANFNSDVSVASGNLAGNPAYITPASDDLSLPTGSPAINAGLNVGLAFNGAAPDIGAHETLAFSSGEVGAVDATTVVVNFENNLRPPLLPATSVAGFTIEEDTGGGFAAKTISGCSRNTDNQMRCTVTVGFSSGSTARFSYSTGTGNITDSALIAQTLTQRLNAITNQAITNNVAGGAPSNLLVQAHARIHGLRGTEAAPAVKAVAGTDYEVAPGSAFRLRLSINCTGTCPSAAAQLRSDKNAGGYGVVTNTVAADGVGFFGEADTLLLPAHQSATTQLVSSGDFVPGLVLRTASAIPSVNLAENETMEIEYVLRLGASVVPGTDEFCFRVYQDDGTALGAYTQTVCTPIKRAVASY